MTVALVGLLCVSTSGGIPIALHFVPTGLDPIRYAASDYGWTSYHVGYRTRSRSRRFDGWRSD